MASKEKKTQTSEAIENEQKYPSELLAQSESMKRFGLHRDIILAILGNGNHSVVEAEKSISKYTNSFKK